MYQYKMKTNKTLKNIGKLFVYVLAVLGTIAFVLVLTKKCCDDEKYNESKEGGTQCCRESGREGPRLKCDKGKCYCCPHKCGKCGGDGCGVLSKKKYPDLAKKGIFACCSNNKAESVTCGHPQDVMCSYDEGELCPFKLNADQGLQTVYSCENGILDYVSYFADDSGESATGRYVCCDKSCPQCGAGGGPGSADPRPTCKDGKTSEATTPSCPAGDNPKDGGACPSRPCENDEDVNCSLGDCPPDKCFCCPKTPEEGNGGKMNDGCFCGNLNTPCTNCTR